MVFIGLVSGLLDDLRLKQVMQETIRWSESMLLNDELAWQFLMLFLHFFLIRMQSICERLPDRCWNVHNLAPGFMKFVFANISAPWDRK